MDSAAYADHIPDGIPAPTVTSIRDLEDAVAGFERSVADLLAHDDGTWSRVERSARADLYRRIEQARNRLALVDTRFLEALVSTGDIPPQRRRRPSWFARTFRIPLREARERIAAASRLSPGCDPWAPDPGAPGPDHMPAITAAVADGTVGTATVAKLDKQLREMPTESQTGMTASADAPVAALLRETDPDIVGKMRPYLLQLAGTEDPFTAADRRRLRGVTVGPQGADGMSRLSGYLTPEAAAVCTRLFADHANAGSLDGGARDIADAADNDDPGASGQPAAAGSEPDPRSPSQRRHDAMFAAITAGYGPGQKLRPGRGATTIVAAMTIDQLLARTGTVTTDAGTTVSVETLIEETDVDDMFLQVMDFRGQTLYLGRSARSANLEQYYALVGEEGMSSAPGSSGAPAFADVHHVTAWGRGGMTDIDNLTLVDRPSHRTVDDSRTNDGRWQTHPPRPGSVERVDWIPPESEDPSRTPRHNSHPMVWDNPGHTLRRNARDRGWHQPRQADGKLRRTDSVWYRTESPPQKPPPAPPRTESQGSAPPTSEPPGTDTAPP